MSSAGSPGRREVAKRVFAVEFDEATHTYRSGDEERAPIYVVSPTGERINRLFVVGVLTESTWVNEDTLRARIADPTGGFVVYAGQYQQEARARLDELTSPAYVAITGKANVFEPDDGDRVWTSIRPEAVAEVDAATRDRWVVDTAVRTFDRLARMAAAMQSNETTDEGIRRARDTYAPSEAYLAALYDRCVAALEIVAGEADAVDESRLQPDLSGDPSIPLDRLRNLLEDGAEAHVPVVTDEDTSSATDEPPETDEPEPSSPTSDASTERAGPETAPAQPDPDAPTEPESASIPADSDEAGIIDVEEREAIESEFGTDFSPGSEMPEPSKRSADAAPPDDTEDASDDATAAGEIVEGDDLVDLVMSTMTDLDDGSGVDRDELVSAVTESADVPARDVTEAITDALMDGRCYEPSEDVVQPI